MQAANKDGPTDVHNHTVTFFHSRLGYMVACLEYDEGIES